MSDVKNEGVFVDSNGDEPTYTKWSLVGNQPNNKHDAGLVHGSPPNYHNSENLSYDDANFVVMNRVSDWTDVGNMDVEVGCQLLCNSGNRVVKKNFEKNHDLLNVP